ncbi:MFS transporter [Streptomyces tricolor]|nr:MFS transporter [Streptomyces tricolor]
MQADNPRRWLTLPVIMSAFFMYGFDAQVVNVALPSLRHDLHAGEAALELIVGGYVFVYATGLVTGGRLGDLIGYRKMFLGGMTAFTLASALCAVSQTRPSSSSAGCSRASRRRRWCRRCWRWSP